MYRTVILISIPLSIHICSEKNRRTKFTIFEKLRSHGFTRINEDKTISSVNLLGTREHMLEIKTRGHL